MSADTQFQIQTTINPDEITIKIGLPKNFGTVVKGVIDDGKPDKAGEFLKLSGYEGDALLDSVGSTLRAALVPHRIDQSHTLPSD